MIQWMHRVSKSFLATILMGALALSFVLWGVGDMFTGGTSTAVATVDGVNIETTTFQRLYRTAIRSQSQATGMEITPEMAQAMGLGQTALQQTIDRTALDNYVSAKGIVASDAQVTETVHAIEAFRGPSGQFDYNQFMNTLQTANYTTEQEFTGEVRADLARNQIVGATQSFFALPGEYVMPLYLHVNEKRAADYVVVPASAAGDIAPPDEKTLTAFVKDNASRFSTPEYRDVQFAAITPADVTVEVTDKMVDDEYAARKATYNIPERRELSQLNFKNEAEARAARAKLDSGTTFEQLVAERGLKPADVTLGTKSAEELSDPAAAKAAFAVAEGQVSQPVQGNFGWVMLKTAKITPGVNKPLESVREEVRAALQTQVAADKLVDVINAYDDARKSGDDLATAAKKAKMKFGRVAAMDSKGLAPDGKPTEAPTDPEFLAAAFRADAGVDNEPMSVKSGAYYVVRVNGTTPPKLKPLAEVRAEAEAQWIQRRRGELLAVRAKALNDQAVKEKSLAGVAKAVNGSVQKSAALGRDTNSGNFPSALVTKLFDARPGAIVYAPQGDGYVIAQLTGISHPKPVPGDRNFISQAQQFSGGLAGDMVSAMVTSQRNAQKPTVNQQNLNAVIGAPQ